MALFHSNPCCSNRCLKTWNSLIALLRICCFPLDRLQIYAKCEDFSKQVGCTAIRFQCCQSVFCGVDGPHRYDDFPKLLFAALLLIAERSFCRGSIHSGQDGSSPASGSLTYVQKIFRACTSFTYAEQIPLRTPKKTYKQNFLSMQKMLACSKNVVCTKAVRAKQTLHLHKAFKLGVKKAFVCIIFRCAQV